MTLPVLMAAHVPGHQQPARQRPSTSRAVPVQHPGPPGTLVIAGREVMQLQPVGYYTDEGRALEVMRRVVRVLEPENDLPSLNLEPFDANRDIKVGRELGKPVVQFKGITIATVTAEDQKAAGMPAPQVAQMWANNLKAGLEALKISARTNEKQVLEQIQVAVGGRTVANGVTGVTETALADRIRRRIERDPSLRQTDLNVDVLSDQVIIHNEGTATQRDVRRLERVIRQEAGDRRIHRGGDVGTEMTPTP
jgi:hypothetical protein